MVGQKNFGPKKVLLQRKSGSKKSLGPKMLISKKISIPKKIVGPKMLISKKNIGQKDESKKMGPQEILGPK